MPITKHPKVTEPLWKEWDYKAQKKGVRNTVYSVNGDQYTGEWNDNKKNGEVFGVSCLIKSYDICQVWSFISNVFFSFLVWQAKGQCSGKRVVRSMMVIGRMTEDVGLGHTV